MGSVIVGVTGTSHEEASSASAPEVVDVTDLFAKEAAEHTAASNKARPVRFVSNFKPDQRVVLSTGTTLVFQNGVAYATSKKDANAFRKIMSKHSAIEG